MKKWITLVLAILACEAAGFIGGFLTASSVTTWYATLAKPAFNPPSWLFGPVWTALYAAMGVALWLAWVGDAPAGKKRIGVGLFAAQLALNVLWSFLFFGLRSPLLAFVELLVLWVFILMTILAFRPLSRAASFLLVPYLLWVSFAGILNLAIVLKNP